jgi:hypothetical protein
MQSPEETFCVQEPHVLLRRGGGYFWKKEREGSRINHMRFDQLSEAKPETLAVGCPFCMT